MAIMAMEERLQLGFCPDIRYEADYVEMACFQRMTRLEPL
jgi:hypothetical protein